MTTYEQIGEHRFRLDLVDEPEFHPLGRTYYTVVDDSGRELSECAPTPDMAAACMFDPDEASDRLTITWRVGERMPRLSGYLQLMGKPKLKWRFPKRYLPRRKHNGRLYKAYTRRMR